MGECILAKGKFRDEEPDSLKSRLTPSPFCAITEESERGYAGAQNSAVVISRPAEALVPAS